MDTFNPWPAPPGMPACAVITGGPLAPLIKGVVWFTDVLNGTEVYVHINGLPLYQPGIAGKPPIGPFGFHIHEMGNCIPGNQEEPFPHTGEHYNPTKQPHGNHVGDFPVLFSNHGLAKMCFFTDKFKIPEVIGRSVVIHQNPDDYRTQPAGASGKKLACGIITFR